MRTSLLREVLKKISKIDREFNHSLFINEQFMIDNDEKFTNLPEVLTSEIFLSNPYKKEFNYKLGKIKNIMKDNNDFLCLSSLIFLYSAYEVYREEMLKLVSKINGKEIPPQENNELPLEPLFKLLNTSSSIHLSREEINTLDWIRLRRNSFIHREGRPSRNLQHISKSKGENMNEYWRKLELKVIDFTKLEFIIYENEVIDYARMLRFLIEKVDKEVLKQIGRQKILLYATKKFKRDSYTKILTKTSERILKNLVIYIKMNFNIDVTIEELKMINN